MIEKFAFETIYIRCLMTIIVCNKLNYINKFENSINKLKAEGRYRVFNETQRKVGLHPLAIWNNNTIKSDITVWCSNDYLGMSQNTHITNTMIDAVREMGTGSGGTRHISGNSSYLFNFTNWCAYCVFSFTSLPPLLEILLLVSNCKETQLYIFHI